MCAQGNAATLATAGGDFGMQQPSSNWDDPAAGNMQVEGAGGWGVDELENALKPEDLHKELKK